MKSENSSQESATESVPVDPRYPPTEEEEYQVPNRAGRIAVLLGTLVIVAIIVVLSGRLDLSGVGRPLAFVALVLVLGIIGGGLHIAGGLGKKKTKDGLWRRLVAAFAPRQSPPASTRKRNPPADNPKAKWFDLLKLEYEKGADRYENIYRAIWLNFSYSVAIGAAILTFAATKFRLELLLFLALSPVVFWFVATFIPMNYYGELTRARLRNIERDFNELFFYDARNGTEFSGETFDLGFRHFTTFAGARALWKVGDVVHLTGGLVGLYWIWLLASVLPVREVNEPLVLPSEASVLQTRLTAARLSADSLDRSIDSLRIAATREQQRLDSLRRVK